MVWIIRAAAEEFTLPGIWSLSPLGALIGAVVLIYWLLASGRLIPRGTHESIVGQERKRGDEWKETAFEQRAVNQEIRVQNTMLLEAQRISDKFYQAMTPPEAGDQRVGT